MSYYEEGQAGLGQFSALLTGGLTLNKTPTTTTTPTSTAGRTNVGLPPDLVASLAKALMQLGQSMGTGDTGRPYVLLGGAALNAIRPNQFGLMDPDRVAQAINVIPAVIPVSGTPLRSWVDGAVKQFGAPSPSAVLADIAAGRYAGTAPALNLRLSPTLASAAALKMQVAATAVQNAQTKQAVADQAAQTAATTQSATDTAAAQQAQATADAAAASAQAATQDAATTAAQVAQPGEVSPADLVAPATATPATATHAAAGSSFPWLYVGIGAAGLAVVGWVLMSRKPSTPNRSRRSKKSRARRARRARKA